MNSGKGSDRFWLRPPEPAVPGPMTGRYGILYVLRTGCAWKEMPQEYGAYVYGMAEVEEVAGGGGMDKDLVGVPLELG